MVESYVPQAETEAMTNGKDSVLEAIEKMIVEPKTYDHRTMEQLYVSDEGDDENDGKTPETAIYSLKRLRHLYKNNTEVSLANPPVWNFR